MTRLALLRHGHTHWNRAGRIQGRTDIALDEEARAQLSGLALPAPWGDADLFSSPLARAAETAQIVARRIPQTDPALIEMNWVRQQVNAVLALPVAPIHFYQRGIGLRDAPRYDLGGLGGAREGAGV